jgi:hypothetical protein
MGTIQVNLESDSVFFNHNVPIEIRDSQMRLVQQSGRDRQFKLPVGLYQVSAVLEDGHKHNELVQVKADAPTQVVLRAPDISEAPRQAPVKARGVAQTSAMAYQRPRFTKRSEAYLVSGDDQAPDQPAQFIEAEGASLLRETRSMWIFECASSLTSVASAVFQIGDRTTTISLPISPEVYTPSGACAVRIEENRTGSHAHAWIAPQRTVANAMQNMLSSGYVVEAAGVADEAIDLLRGKYEDPTGAVLGALILHKTGRLRRWQGWVKNLAMDFDWLPDGKVMLATMLYDDPATQDEAMELAFAASKQRMLFSENLSLLLDLLRRFPGKTYRSERTEAIKSLATMSPYIDWESICLSYYKPEETT